MDNYLTVYTDGSCRPTNPGPGGWAYATEDGRSGSGGTVECTNNRAEIMGVVQALEELKETNIRIYSDSSYVINTMSKGWKRKTNIDLWERLDRARKGKNVEWVWIRGHNGNLMNGIVDKMAGEAALNVTKEI